MIAITHPIKQLINNQYDFLSSMLNHFPSLLEDWVHKQEKEVKQLANEFANGDSDVYTSIYSSEISRVDFCYDEEQLFNQAMLIMVYSYYESILLRIAKEINVDKTRPSIIAEKYGMSLEKDYLKISTFLFNTVAPLRNQLCHNNQGTLFEKSSKEEIEIINILNEKQIITIDEGRISTINGSFIKYILDAEYKLLLKLADICGFKTDIYKNHDGSFRKVTSTKSNQEEL